MGYCEFQPHPALTPYIDAYWVVKTEKVNPTVSRIMPDGCVDIIINSGSDFLSENGAFTMKNDKVYLVGTMTVFKDTVQRDNTHLIGIRFKPLGFPAFYRFSALDEITNTTVEFEKNLAPEIHELNSETVVVLDQFFLSRISINNPFLSKVLWDVKTRNGIITVHELAKNNVISGRQLERKFRHYLGISPKEYINFVRYQFAIDQIRNNSHKSLLDVAFSTGYYDHSHLTNEIKKYSGLLPSEL
jgi:AraC-like DNA-binding protein